MAYNYLGLINDICVRVNETQLTSSNFSTAMGMYATMKEAVNSSIRHIGQDKFEWPFYNIEEEETLTAGTVRYPYPYNAKHVDMDSFRIKRNDTFNNRTVKLKKINYEEYLEHAIDDEYNTDTGIRRLPMFVFQTQDQEFGVWPVPDNDYELVYEYFSLSVDLNLYSDIPVIPQAFRHIITDIAMWYMNLWQSDYEAADRIKQHYDDSLDNMRIIYINRYDHIQDNRIIAPRSGFGRYTRDD